MGSILRWFDVGGRRHRAWFRHAADGSRELVVAGPDFIHVVAADADTPLDDLPEQRLVELARLSNAGTQHG